MKKWPLRLVSPRISISSDWIYNDYDNTVDNNDFIRIFIHKPVEQCGLVFIYNTIVYTEWWMLRYIIHINLKMTPSISCQRANSSVYYALFALDCQYFQGISEYTCIVLVVLLILTSTHGRAHGVFPCINHKPPQQHLATVLNVLQLSVFCRKCYFPWEDIHLARITVVTNIYTHTYIYIYI